MNIDGIRWNFENLFELRFWFRFTMSPSKLTKLPMKTNVNAGALTIVSALRVESIVESSKPPIKNPAFKRVLLQIGQIAIPYSFATLLFIWDQVLIELLALYAVGCPGDTGTNAGHDPRDDQHYALGTTGTPQATYTILNRCSWFY